MLAAEADSMGPAAAGEMFPASVAAMREHLHDPISACSASVISSQSPASSCDAEGEDGDQHVLMTSANGEERKSGGSNVRSSKSTKAKGGDTDNSNSVNDENEGSEAAAGGKARRRRSKHVPQRDDDFVRQLRQFMKDYHYTQFDLAANLQCSQAKVSHFLCMYMSEKAHAKMVKLAAAWQKNTDHTIGLAERARRACPGGSGGVSASSASVYASSRRASLASAAPMYPSSARQSANSTPTGAFPLVAQRQRAPSTSASLPTALLSHNLGPDGGVFPRPASLPGPASLPSPYPGPSVVNVSSGNSTMKSSSDDQLPWSFGKSSSSSRIVSSVVNAHVVAGENGVPTTPTRRRQHNPNRRGNARAGAHTQASMAITTTTATDAAAAAPTTTLASAVTPTPGVSVHSELENIKTLVSFRHGVADILGGCGEADEAVVDPCSSATQRTSNSTALAAVSSSVFAGDDDDYTRPESRRERVDSGIALDDVDVVSPRANDDEAVQNSSLGKTLAYASPSVPPLPAPVSAASCCASGSFKSVADWCGGCREGGRCMRTLTEEDFALAWELLELARVARVGYVHSFGDASVAMATAAHAEEETPYSTPPGPTSITANDGTRQYVTEAFMRSEAWGRHYHETDFDSPAHDSKAWVAAGLVSHGLGSASTAATNTANNTASSTPMQHPSTPVPISSSSSLPGGPLAHRNSNDHPYAEACSTTPETLSDTDGGEDEDFANVEDGELAFREEGAQAAPSAKSEETGMTKSSKEAEDEEELDDGVVVGVAVATAETKPPTLLPKLESSSSLGTATATTTTTITSQKPTRRGQASQQRKRKAPSSSASGPGSASVVQERKRRRSAVAPAHSKQQRAIACSSTPSSASIASWAAMPTPVTKPIAPDSAYAGFATPPYRPESPSSSMMPSSSSNPYAAAPGYHRRVAMATAVQTDMTPPRKLSAGTGSGATMGNQFSAVPNWAPQQLQHQQQQLQRHHQPYAPPRGAPAHYYPEQQRYIPSYQAQPSQALYH